MISARGREAIFSARLELQHAEGRGRRRRKDARTSQAPFERKAHKVGLWHYLGRHPREKGGGEVEEVPVSPNSRASGDRGDGEQSLVPAQKAVGPWAVLVKLAGVVDPRPVAVFVFVLNVMMTKGENGHLPKKQILCALDVRLGGGDDRACALPCWCPNSFGHAHIKGKPQVRPAPLSAAGPRHCRIDCGHDCGTVRVHFSIRAWAIIKTDCLVCHRGYRPDIHSASSAAVFLCAVEIRLSGSAPMMAGSAGAKQVPSYRRRFRKPCSCSWPRLRVSGQAPIGEVLRFISEGQVKICRGV